MKVFLFFLSFIMGTVALTAEEKIDKLLKAFNTYAEEQRIAWNIPGMAIGIVYKGEIVLQKGYGTKGLKDVSPVDETTLFQIGSLSKAFTSALVSIAEDKKWLKWHDPVVKYLPTFSLKESWATEQFQIIDLLCQRSGLPPYAGDIQSMLGFSAEEIIHNLRYLHPLSSFRSEYAYQNSFFLVASQVLESITQTPYAKLLKNEILAPLGMNHTSTTLQAYLNSTNKAEWLMRMQDGSTVRLEENFPYREWNYILAPAGGINSTVADMCKWMLLQTQNGKIKGENLISSNNMEQMRRNMIFVEDKAGSELYYALGWVRMERSPYPLIWHDGSTLGVYNVAAYIPEEELGIVILSNVRNTKLSLALALQFFDMYEEKPDQNWSQLFLSQITKSKEEVLKTVYTPMPLTNYVGIYENPIYGRFEIKEEADHLTLRIEKKSLKLSLTPWNRDAFILNWPLVEDDPVKVFFVMGEDGSIETMKIDAFEKEGSGDFVKIY